MPSARRPVAALLVLGALAAPGPADAAPRQAPPPAEPRTFRGETVQDRSVAVSVGADGLVRRLRVTWTATCRRDRFRYSTDTIARSPFDRVSVDALRDERRFRETSPGDVVGRITTSVTARRSGSGARERWSGTFRATVSVRRAGRVVDACRTATLRWSARPAAARSQDRRAG